MFKKNIKTYFFQNLSIVFILFGFPLLSFAATWVNPVLSGTHVWTSKGNPYFINQDTRLLPGATLIIEPGVKVEVSNAYDTSIPQGTDKIDFFIQGQLIVNGSSFAPVVFDCQSKQSTWGALYVVSSQTKSWKHIIIKRGRVIIWNARLNLIHSRIANGLGITVGGRSKVTFYHTQIDKNHIGLYLISSKSKINLIWSRLYKNDVGIYFQAKPQIFSENSSILLNQKFQVINRTKDNIILPPFWWGTTNQEKIEEGIYDYKNNSALGSIQFSAILGYDPTVSEVHGFVPAQSPRQLFWKGPHYLVGVFLPVSFAQLKLPNHYSSSLGKGLLFGLIMNKFLETRIMFENINFSYSNALLNQSSNLTFWELGVFERYHLPILPKNTVSIFGEAGAFLNYSNLTEYHPENLSNISTPIINNSFYQTNIDPALLLGISVMITPKYFWEIEGQYEIISLGENAGGSILGAQTGINFYF